MSATRSRATLAAAVLGVGALVLAACDTGSTTGAAQGDGSGKTPRVSLSATAKPKPPQAKIHTNVRATGVPVDKVVQVTGTHAKLSTVTVSSSAGELPGRLSTADNTWTASALLEPGTAYTVRSTVRSDAGRTLQRTATFRTQNLSLAQQTFPSVSPMGGTVGIGMPVIVHFDVPVTDRASIERHMHVTSSSHQFGSWSWFSSTEAHWRPAHYWQPGTDVSVDVNINSVPAGNGIYGQLDRHISFHVGDAHIYRVSTRTDQLRVFSGGQLVRTIPVTTGQQPQYTTRSGVKVIVEKFRHVRMNSETVGIDPHGPNGYNIGNVQYAMRLTFSGEFLHAAPWSVAAQGNSNVSHGCTGMSTANAKWLYDFSQVGDVVEYTGSNRPMTLTNGYGDWNEPFSTWSQGSALS